MVTIFIFDANRPIPKGDLEKKKTTPDIEAFPESLGAMLDFLYIERGLLQNFKLDNHVITRRLCGK